EMVVDGGFGNAEFLSNFFHYQTLRKQFNDFDSSIRQYRLRGEFRIFMGSNNLCIVSENHLAVVHVDNGLPELIKPDIFQQEPACSFIFEAINKAYITISGKNNHFRLNGQLVY